MTCAPQALLTVPMSMPWSRVQSLGGSTLDRGVSGNTSPLGPPDEPGTAVVLVTLCTTASSIDEVRSPTVPLAGYRRLDSWKRLTARLVTLSKLPVTGTT